MQLLAISQMDSIENFTPNKQVKKLKNVKIVSQNVRGLKSESRLEELFSYAARFWSVCSVPTGDLAY